MFPGVPTIPIMQVGATDSAELRAKGVQAYDIGTVFSAEDLKHIHGNDERIQIAGFGKFVEFLYWQPLKLQRAGSDISQSNLALVNVREQLQAPLILFAKALSAETPRPVAAESAGSVHASFTAQPQHVLHWEQDRISHGLHHFPDKNPVHFAVKLFGADARVVLRVSVFLFHVVLRARALGNA